MTTAEARRAGTAFTRDGLRGFALGMTAYVMWGFLPFYMKAVAHISPYEVVAHRILWSVPVAAILLAFQGGFGEFSAALRNRRTLALALMTALLITVNWTLYVWAIGAGRALETALGYYINPLVNVALGVLLLKERFTRPQMFAIALAVIGVVIMTVESGGLPWVSLALACTFGLYGYFKKTLPIAATPGFLLEVTIVSPFALLYIAHGAVVGDAHFVGLAAGAQWSDTLLLMFAGVVTAVPLILFSAGARYLRFSTLGLMQYVAPTMIFLTAVFAFGEPFSSGRLVAFAFIWAALVVYTASLFARGRRS